MAAESSDVPAEKSACGSSAANSWAAHRPFSPFNPARPHKLALWVLLSYSVRLHLVHAPVGPSARFFSSSSRPRLTHPHNRTQTWRTRLRCCCPVAHKLNVSTSSSTASECATVSSSSFQWPTLVDDQVKLHTCNYIH